MSEENDFRPLEERERRLLETLLEHHPFDGTRTITAWPILLRPAGDTEFQSRGNIWTTMESRCGCCSTSTTKEQCASLKSVVQMDSPSFRLRRLSGLRCTEIRYARNAVIATRTCLRKESVGIAAETR
jgi:hypothetical protein